MSILQRVSSTTALRPADSCGLYALVVTDFLLNADECIVTSGTQVLTGPVAAPRLFLFTQMLGTLCGLSRLCYRFLRGKVWRYPSHSPADACHLQKFCAKVLCESFVRKFCAKVLCESFDRKFWAVFFLEPDSESRSAGLGWAGLGWLGWAGLGWLGWAGLGWGWLGWAGLGWALGWAGLAGLGWAGAGLGWAGLGWLGWAGLGWAGLDWTGLGWAGLGWAGLGGWAGAGLALLACWAAGLWAGAGLGGWKWGVGGWAWLGGLGWAGWAALKLKLVYSKMAKLCPDRKYELSNGQQQQAISIYFFLEGLGFRV